jgi:hypothetical protein
MTLLPKLSTVPSVTSTSPSTPREKAHYFSKKSRQTLFLEKSSAFNSHLAVENQTID